MPLKCSLLSESNLTTLVEYDSYADISEELQSLNQNKELM